MSCWVFICWETGKRPNLTGFGPSCFAGGGTMGMRSGELEKDTAHVSPALCVSPGVKLSGQ